MLAQNTVLFVKVRIPLKWGTYSGDVGRRRSEATSGVLIIAEVPHLGQEEREKSGVSARRLSFRFHHFVSSSSSPQCSIPVSGAPFR